MPVVTTEAAAARNPHSRMPCRRTSARYGRWEIWALRERKGVGRSPSGRGVASRTLCLVFGVGLAVAPLSGCQPGNKIDVVNETGQSLVIRVDSSTGPVRETLSAQREGVLTIDLSIPGNTCAEASYYAYTQDDRLVASTNAPCLGSTWVVTSQPAG